MHKKPTELYWTPELVSNFWNLFANSPLTGISFSRACKTSLVSFIQSVHPAPCTVLDFGCGDGDLAAALLDAGYQVGIYEPSVERRNCFLSMPIAHHPGFLGCFSTPARTFDLVCAFEVLEHLLPEALESDMALLASFVGKGGFFVGSVPAEEDLSAGMSICPQCEIVYHRMQHVRSFSHQELEYFLKKNGFTHYSVCIARFTASFLFVASSNALPNYPPVSDYPISLHQALLEAYNERDSLLIQVEKQKKMIELIPNKVYCILQSNSLSGRFMRFCIRVLRRMHKINLF